jgi:hypothetical protein
VGSTRDKQCALVVLISKVTQGLKKKITGFIPFVSRCVKNMRIYCKCWKCGRFIPDNNDVYDPITAEYCKKEDCQKEANRPTISKKTSFDLARAENPRRFH